MSDAAAIDTLEALVTVVELVDVRTVRIEGRLFDPDNDEEERLTVAGGIGTIINDDFRGIIASMSADRAGAASGVVRAAVEARYSYPEEATVAADVLEQFFLDVATMSMFPYLREAVSTTANTLRLPRLMLPIIRRSSLGWTAMSDQGDTDT